MNKFWSDMVKRTQPYEPGEQLNDPHIIKLNTNENPYEPSPSVKKAIVDEMDGGLQLYPSPTADMLRSAIATAKDVSMEEVFVGNGSDEVLAFSFMAFFQPGKTIRFPSITYSFYPVYSKLFDIPFEQMPLKEDFTIDVESFFDSEGGVILPNPNAPTSIYEELATIEQIIEKNPHTVVIIDEAYIDFAGPSAIELIRKYDNLLVIQTTSKSRSLAGMRVGYAIGNSNLIDALVRLKDSFNSYTVDRLAMAAATAAFEDKAYLQKTVSKIKETREWTVTELERLGFDVLPSSANFVFAVHRSVKAIDLYEYLKEEKILVRHFNIPLIDNYLRISIGTDEQMNVLLNKISSYLMS
ncbi:histidinol-phosphate transaminase [Sporosarcina sp. Sa2YVA2]|uniref:Histidinol-phosphate aminotransferase n=1 Tax=Sporosarcina quadrami TaxID=2762234 RepID=A0ABR8U9U0_9BACL|nr:histidinol-phosphate transaminase [Sporosarcina quadrami]MBD7984478.1 histidinol-phosphate transaminase [Sporosarcina quadrami]